MEGKTMTETVTPKVCIQCLASYNAGRLIFEWVDATEGLEGLEAAQAKVAERAIAAAKAAGEWPVYFGEPEEFMLADWEGFPEGTVGEYTQLSEVAEFAEQVEELADRAEAYTAYVGVVGAQSATIEGFEEAYRGEWDSMADYAEEFATDCGWSFGDGTYVEGSQIEAMSGYLDFEAFANELETGEYSYVDGYVFCTC